MLQDLRYALRQLMRNPGFTFIAALSLALGIGANTAIFGLIDHVMLRALPVQNPSELAVIRGQFSYPRYVDMRDRTQVFSSLAATHVLSDMTVTMPGQPSGQASGELVSGNYFSTLGVTAAIGRTILPEDDLKQDASP